MTKSTTVKDKDNKLVDWLGALGLITMVGWLKGTIARGMMTLRQDGTKTRYNTTKAHVMVQWHKVTIPR